MTKLTVYTRYADALTHVDSKALWELFDGNRERLNIAHECIVRHADGSGRTAIRIAHTSGSDEIHCGRAHDVIIAAGWTMSAVEIENTLLKHSDVKQAAAIGVPDATRGQVVKAFIVSERSPSDDFVDALQTFTRERLSQHGFPRHIAFVSELPKTPAGKVHRKILRDREATARLTLSHN
jgi:non-ribosomal peptide synthetase component E (peptide arylation enzyme)